jgi:quercetin dioxygenase-like cupin family protein
MHAHPDPETFVHLSGGLEGLRESEDGFRWTPIRPGEVFHVPSGAKHAFRNP